MARILIVDDSPTILNLIAEMLAQGDHEVLKAMDGEAAVQLTNQQQPDLVLLDVILPRLNGYQVCRQIKSSPETAQIPIIMITRKAREKDRQWGVEQGADGYITKPFTATELLETVGHLMAVAD